MAQGYGSGRGQAGASEFSRHIASAGDIARRAPAAVRSFAEAQSTATAATAALGVGLAWWGLRAGGLVGTAALLVGGWAISRIWPELIGEE